MKRIVNSLFFSLLALFLVGCTGESKYVLQSPEGRLSVKVGQSDEGVLFTVFTQGMPW